ncbi:hypothetical protein [Kitasatospora azatica]|uniref:hypothetical protein n=1 Tax=Kitasatospora azatica TaxID=58347 RepID=UPI000564360C|nr:hypothetical protein [Kitasatospora azatica]
MTGRHPARIAAEVGRVIKVMPTEVREELRLALERAEIDPWSYPQADRYDTDDTVRVIVLNEVILHFAIVPVGEPPHLWVFAAALL